MVSDQAPRELTEIAGLLEHGVLKGGQKYYPSAVHTDEDVERTIEAYRQVVPTLRG